MSLKSRLFVRKSSLSTSYIILFRVYVVLLLPLIQVVFGQAALHTGISAMLFIPHTRFLGTSLLPYDSGETAGPQLTCRAVTTVGPSASATPRPPPGATGKWEGGREKSVL